MKYLNLYNNGKTATNITGAICRILSRRIKVYATQKGLGNYKLWVHVSETNRIHEISVIGSSFMSNADIVLLFKDIKWLWEHSSAFTRADESAISVLKDWVYALKGLVGLHIHKDGIVKYDVIRNMAYVQLPNDMGTVRLWSNKTITLAEQITVDGESTINERMVFKFPKAVSIKVLIGLRHLISNRDNEATNILVVELSHYCQAYYRTLIIPRHK